VAQGLRDALRSPATLLALLVLGATALLALSAPFLGLPDPEAMDGIPYEPPGAGSLLGTDNFGRDVFARVAWGARLALMVAIVSAALSSLLGVVLGALSGYHGGWLDEALSRVFDVFLLIPTFFLVLLIVALFGSSIAFTMLAIALTTWPRSARIMRSQVLSLKSRTYVQAALAAGASHRRVLARHIVPNALPPIVTDATILMGLAILTEAGLSFLGLGDQDAVSWGRMIFEGQRHLRLAPWISVFPGIALLLLVAALNLLGDALNRSLNPALRRLGAPARRAPPLQGAALPVADRAAPAVAVRDLRYEYRLADRRVRAVDGVTFTLPRGGSLGIVGESGCGKSSLGAALLQIMPPNAAITGGDVALLGAEVLRGGRVLRVGRRDAIEALRWRQVSVVFQSAMNALNPVRSIRRQLLDAYFLHAPGARRAEAEARIAELLAAVSIPPARLDAYPHELSGGMRQRMMIALALLHRPELVIADEPTTALDVLIQDQILGELDELRRRLGLALILVSHDLGAVAETCERVAVMYAGEFVEVAPTAAIFGDARHPYTRALIAALPGLEGPKHALASLPGEPFVPGDATIGCRFAARCTQATDLCRQVAPPRLQVADGHEALCHFAADGAGP
jgi:peptide/nickel transport system permease protein